MVEFEEASEDFVAEVACPVRAIGLRSRGLLLLLGTRSRISGSQEYARWSKS